jgi:hypothetical protein
MSPPTFFCGDALCKARLPSSAATDGPWPRRCDTCGTALYPVDVLERLPSNELEPKRAELMTERAGVRVSVRSTELSQPSRAPAASSGDGDVDRILAMVELNPTSVEVPSRRRPTVVLIGVVVAAIVLLAIIVVATRLGP